MRELGFLLIFSLLFLAPAIAQSPNATINGIVLDPSGATIAGAQVVVVNDATGVQYTTKTNGEGIYVVPNLPPGPYRIQVSNSGFKTIIKPEITLHVQDALAINFTLPIGAASEVVTVAGLTPLINTESATVSTVVDRQFAENLPMNGRSFQTLIQLTPGVVTLRTTGNDSGQFSVNGQRADSNYWMLDGVSANIGASSFAGPAGGLGGTLGSFSVTGGTNSLVSIDAMQEFRIQTSTYAPEFGRAPGAQISIITRSGTDRFRGTAFDYLRNDIFDANDWFNTSVRPALRKAQERQNDFGGTLGGPILKDRTFFFFSYEGLRLRLPQTALTTVPDVSARQTATPALQPFLKAFPLPNGPDNPATGIAQFNASYSNPSTLDAYSLRIDHHVGHRLNLFGRYNYSPSDLGQRGVSSSLSTVLRSHITTQTLTVGATSGLSPQIGNDLRINYSRSGAGSDASVDGFGGAVPLASEPFPNIFTAQNARFFFGIFSLTGQAIITGRNGRNSQRQINVVDSLSWQKGTHSLKFGADFRRLAPQYEPLNYGQTVFFFSVPSAEAGNVGVAVLQSNRNSTLLFHNLGSLAQDTWRVLRRLTVTYGVRWDLDVAPSAVDGPNIPAVAGYDPNNLSNLSLAPPGTPLFHTTFGNVAPRVGVAYQPSQSQKLQTVLRGGVGVFYDLATSQTGNAIQSSYPFGASAFHAGGTFPLSNLAAAAPPITVSGLSSPGSGLYSFDPNLKLPYTVEWNFALEQALGDQQSISASYIGAVGRRLLQSAFVNSPNSSFSAADLVGNTATSSYNALQAQFQRRLSLGLQLLASYTWSHSIDDDSAGSYGNAANGLIPALKASANRGPSDFDIRNAFTAGATYDLPAPRINSFTRAILGGWSLQNVIEARSAAPVNVYYSQIASGQLFGAQTQIRPDVVPGIPLYVFGPRYPGGKAFNNTPGAVMGGCPDGSQSVGPFCPPPVDANGNPVRQGNLGRNALRGFGATQWDFAVHRDFPIRESLKLQFRAEMFNVLNHPNFGQPIGDLVNPVTSNLQFGRATQMLGNYLAGGTVGGGSLSPLYQIGGPRSIQFALKVRF